MRRVRVWWPVLVIVLAAWSCQYASIYPPETPSLAQYEQVLEGNTRQAVLYRQFATKLRVWATHYSGKFRRAYVERYAFLFGLTPAKKAEMMAAQMGEDARFIRFMFAANTLDPKYNNFAERKSSWRIWLDNGRGGQLDPYEIRAVRRPMDKVQGFFTYINRQYKAYEVRFLRRDKKTGAPFLVPGQQFSFNVAGVDGKVKLVFN